MLRKVLVLYSPDHSGHKMAATAIEEAFNLCYPQTNVRGINLIKYTNPLLGAAATATYRGLVRNHPSLWRFFYDNVAVKEKTGKLRDIVHLSGYLRLRKIMDDLAPDAVICTQAFPCIMVDKFKSITGHGPLLVGVVTDFFVNLFWNLKGVDLFCVAAEESKTEFVEMGAPAERIEVTGIPVRPRFARERDREKGRPGSSRAILLMGGVRGLGPMATVAERLCELTRNVRVIAVAGRNKRLQKKLAGVASRHPERLVVLEYVDNIDELMSQSDLLISKAGGITTSECLARKLPMVLVSPIPGQEVRNAEFLVEKGVAVLANGAHDAARTAADLVRDGSRLDRMKEGMAELSRPDSSLRIVDKIVAMSQARPR